MSNLARYFTGAIVLAVLQVLLMATDNLAALFFIGAGFGLLYAWAFFWGRKE